MKINVNLSDWTTTWEAFENTKLLTWAFTNNQKSSIQQNDKFCSVGFLKVNEKIETQNLAMMAF